MTNKKKFRVALLGCGRVSTRYFEVFSGELADEAQLIGVCDKVPAQMDRFVKQFGAAPAASLAALLALKPDIVVVLTESGSHYEHARTVLEAGIPVIVEKPVTLRVEQARELAALAASKGVMCAVIKQNRYNPAIRFARQAVDEGRFGRIFMGGVRVHWSRAQSYYEDGWHGTWQMDGGVLTQQAIHHVDVLQWLLGPVTEVCARGDHLVNSLEAEDTAMAMIKFASGAFGSIEATTGARPRDIEASLTILGTEASIRIGGVALNTIESWEPVNKRQGDEDVIKRFSQDVPTGYGLGHGPYLLDVFQRLRDGRIDPPVDPDSASKSLALVHACYASMERKGWVRMVDNPWSARLGKSNLHAVAD
jgi:UDP-N-acetyl-2-amino-2-deoxyglucuronate dehydrogenase